MSEINQLIIKKNNIYYEINELNNKINELKHFTNEIDNIIYKICKHEWKNEYYGSVERYTICSKCSLYRRVK